MGDNPGLHALRVQRDFSTARADQVFDGFIGLYDDPRPEWIVESRRDLRVGGTWDVTFQPPGVEAFREHRVVTAVDRPHHLQYTATILRADTAAVETAVTLTVDRAGDGARVTLTQAGFPDIAQRDDFARAWLDVLGIVADRIGEGS